VSACNIFTQGGAAYLLSDGARCYRGGEIADIGSKVAAIFHLHMALGFTGAWYEGQFEKWAEMFRRSADFISYLPEMAERAKEHWNRLNDCDDYNFQVFVARYDWDRGEPALHIYSTDDGGFGQFRKGMHAVRAFATPATAKPPRAADLLDPAKFDIERDAVGLLEAQRAVIWPGGYRAVGGFVELTCVDRSGVNSRVLHRWPDKVGEKIPLV
jgi:hypothetical protein